MTAISSAATVPDPFSQPGSLGVWYDHLIRREQDHSSPNGRRSDWRDRFFFSARGQELFCSRGSQPCGKCRDGYQRVCRRNINNQYALPHQLVSSHSCSTPSCTSASTHHPGFHSPAHAACAYCHNGSDDPAHVHTASHPVPTRLCLSHTTMVQTGRNLVCGFNSCR